MGFFQRLFSAEYRQAIAAEAQGEYLTAARHFALCGETEKVVDMHLAQARSSTNQDDHLRFLRSALDFTTHEDSRRPMILRLLGQALYRSAHDERQAAALRRRQLQEAATVFEAGESWELAAKCYLELSDEESAAAVYAKAGLVEQVEEVLSRHEAVRSQQLREDSLFKDYELLWQEGKRDEATEALRGCIELAHEKGDYRRLLAEIERKMLKSGRITLESQEQQLTCIGHFPLVLGRDSDCDLQTGGPSVSRRHAHILYQLDQGFSLADCGSRNGTLLNSLLIGGAINLPSTGTIGLGDSCTIEFSQLEQLDPVALRLEISRGLNQGRVAVASAGPLALEKLISAAPALVITFVRGKPWARTHAEKMQLNGAWVSNAVQLIQGDTVELSGIQVRVMERS